MWERGKEGGSARGQLLVLSQCMQHQALRCCQRMRPYLLIGASTRRPCISFRRLYSVCPCLAVAAAEESASAPAIAQRIGRTRMRM
eukprot:847239-Rhodomonas_salina.3